MDPLGTGDEPAAVGVVFGLPSLRIKGFYLAVATLAAQFFLSWCFVTVPWLVNHNVSNAMEVPTRTMFEIPITGPNATPVVRGPTFLPMMLAPRRAGPGVRAPR